MEIFAMNNIHFLMKGFCTVCLECAGAVFVYSCVLNSIYDT